MPASEQPLLTAESEALLAELAESPLAGAWYARHVAILRLPAIERAAEQRAATREAAARFVATHWRDAVMASDVLRETGMSHPLAMVLAALDGETDPRELGLTGEAWPAFRAALDEAGGAG